MKKNKKKLVRKGKISRVRNKRTAIKYQQARTFDLSTPNSNSLTRGALERAANALQSGKSQEAYNLCINELQKNPADTEALNIAGVAAFQVGDTNQAISLLETAISFRPEFSDAYNNLGNVHKSICNLEHAETAYRNAIIYSPESSDAEFNLGILLEAKGLFREAELSYRRCVELTPGMVVANFNLGNVLKALGRLKESEIAYKRAIDIEPSNSEALNNIGVVLIELGRQSEATNAFRKAIRFQPEFAEAHYNLGIVLQESDKYEEAILAYKQALMFDPGHVGAEVNIGYCLKELGRLGAAKTAYLKALKIAPDYDKALVNLGDLFLQQGNPSAAIRVCGNFLKEHPGNISVLAFLNIALANSGDLDAVRKFYDFDRLLHSVNHNNILGIEKLSQFNQILSEHILDHPSLVYQPKSHATRFGSHSGELLIEPMGPVDQLKEMILEAVKDYCLAVPIDLAHPWLKDRPEIFNLSIWGVAMEKQGHQISHIHPSAWLSGVYYSKIPDLILADDPGNEGWIEFGRPSDDFSVTTEPVIKLIKPEEGLMLLFPSYFYHRTIPFDFQETRISIAFDIF
jgi:tetratricopeptide (TPR) repeat protein